MTILDEYGTPEKWAQIATHPAYREVREELLRAGEEFLACPIPALSFRDWMQYHEGGTRASYEKGYFQRRGRLAVFSLLARMTEEPRWLSALEETIWAVCEEFAWAVPAHLAQIDDVEQMPAEMDLFSAETAYALGELCALLGERLSPLLRGRIKAEVRRRVIDPFLAKPPRHWRWETWENNWVSVCACGITHVLLYLGEPGELEAGTERLLSYVDRFLAGFPQDGACLEGSSYWLYGFGFFTQMAETLFWHTGGALNLFALEKVEQIAGFLPKTCLCGKWAVMISDANNKEFVHDPGLTHLLARRFASASLLPQALHRPVGMDECYRFGTLLRNLLWTSPTAGDAVFPAQDVHFPHAQWYIANRKLYACVLKGGHNDEPHNHNDIGHVSLATEKDGYLLCDLGAGAYTADYFHPDTRYTKLNNASRGHSVPLVNGKEQLPGKNYSGCLEHPEENTVMVEFSKAYGQPELRRLERTLRFLENEVILTDAFTFTACPAALEERFVTEVLPVITDECVLLGGSLSLIWDKALWMPQILREEYTDHFSVARTAYIIAFTPKEAAKQMHFQLTMKMRCDATGKEDENGNSHDNPPSDK